MGTTWQWFLKASAFAQASPEELVKAELLPAVQRSGIGRPGVLFHGRHFENQLLGGALSKVLSLLANSHSCCCCLWWRSCRSGDGRPKCRKATFGRELRCGCYQDSGEDIVNFRSAGWESDKGGPGGSGWMCES